MLKSSILLLIIFLAACSSVERDFGETSQVLEKAMPYLEYEEQSVSGSIYRDQPRSTKFGFRRNFGVGDILTVVLNEHAGPTKRNQHGEGSCQFTVGPIKGCFWWWSAGSRRGQIYGHRNKNKARTKSP